MIEVWRVTNNKEEVKTFNWWEKDKAFHLAKAWSVAIVKVYIFEGEQLIWTNQ